MVVNAVLYTFPADKADLAAGMLRELRDITRKEPGCIRFEVARGIQNPEVFALHEEYADEQALEAHLASEHFNRLGINGIRKLAKERIGCTCKPLD